MTYLLLLSGKNFGGLVYFDGFLVFTFPVCYNFVMTKYGKRSFSRCFFVGKRTFYQKNVLSCTLYCDTYMCVVFKRHKK